MADWVRRPVIELNYRPIVAQRRSEYKRLRRRDLKKFLGDTNKTSVANARARISVVCGTTEEVAEKLGDLGVSYKKGPSAAKAAFNFIGITRGMNLPSPSILSSSAACEVVR